MTDTEEQFEHDSWETVKWEWQGQTDAFYALSKNYQDLKIPGRLLQNDDVGAKWLFKLQDVFIEWFDAAKPEWERLTDKQEFNAIDSKVGPGGLAEAVQTFPGDTDLRDQDTAEGERMVRALNENPRPIQLVPLSKASNLPGWLTSAMADMAEPHAEHCWQE